LLQGGTNADALLVCEHRQHLRNVRRIGFKLCKRGRRHGEYDALSARGRRALECGTGLQAQLAEDDGGRTETGKSGLQQI